MTSYIICAFVSGFLLAAAIFWIVNRRQQKDWHDEYRRLMGGIEKACELIEKGNIGQSLKCLSDTYYDNPIWPRK